MFSFQSTFRILKRFSLVPRLDRRPAMKSAILCWCVSAFAMTGCGFNMADVIMKERIQVLGELATAIENSAPQATVDALEARYEKLDKELQDVGLSQEEFRKLMSRHKTELLPAVSRLNNAKTAKQREAFEIEAAKRMQRLNDKSTRQPTR